jgi:very-short-patch-repair endonuclease
MSSCFCILCSIDLSHKPKNKFCSKSCAAKFNNTRRKPRTNISKEKTRNSILMLQYPKTKVKFCKCEYCLTNFIWNDIQKGSKRFCSQECIKENLSVKQSIRLKTDLEYRKRLGRSNMSYMEISFAEYLRSAGLAYEQEKQFYNHILKRSYFVDFYFSELNLAIELDGSQHLKTKVQDSIRDKFITEHFGINIIRVSHKEYQSKSRIDEINMLLGIGTG